jgi:hypothetical protein
MMFKLQMTMNCQELFLILVRHRIETKAYQVTCHMHVIATFELIIKLSAQTQNRELFKVV